MIKYITLAAIVALRIVYNPSPAQTVIAPFASPSPVTTSIISAPPAKLVRVDGSISNNKMILNWAVEKNETAAMFEVEKSSDGKNFSMAALVFGTDKAETGIYQFFERAAKQRMFYRIKLIDKNGQGSYSDVITINPAS
ncbi:MAG: hypothetical protein SGI96_17690 [Bacteroidota bacterium]|nr:hypothetical protein [Bacteroidota bacterium]